MLTANPDGISLRCETPTCTLTNWGFGITLDGQAHAVSRLEMQPQSNTQTTLRVHFAHTPVHLDIEVTSSADGTLTARPQLVNPAQTPVSVGRVALLETAAPLTLGHTPDIVCLPLPGHISPRFVYHITTPECPRESKIKALFYNRSRRTALLLGFLTFHRCDTVVHHQVDAAGNLATLSATCNLAGWELAGGTRTPLEELVLQTGPDPYALLEAWADAAASRCHPRQWEDVPVGWLGWAWVDAFNVENYEATMLRNCRAIRERLPGLPISYVWLSIGNLAGGLPGRWLDWDTRNFPSGPQGLAAKLGALGFRLGLWCAPFYISSNLHELVQDMDDALLRKDGERMVVRQEWSYGDAGSMPPGQRPKVYALDPSHPKSHAFVRHVFQTYRRWGVRYYMIDFLNAGSGTIGQFVYDQHHDQRLVAGPEAYQALMQTIRETVSDDTYLLSSSGPMVHNAGVFDAIRTGNDFGEGRQLSPESFFYPATYVINGGEFWTGPLYALRNQACAYYTHRRLYINDSGNVLTVDSPLPLEDARIHATIHVFGASPSMLGDDVERMAPERLDLIRKTLPRPRDIARPLDLFDTPFPDYPKLFARHVVTPWGSYRLLAIYNMERTPSRHEIPLERLGISPETPQATWEFWNQEYLGVVADQLSVTVPPRSVRVFRLSDAEPHPTLLGTDMHLTMGEIDLNTCRWNPQDNTLSGTATRPDDTTGAVFLRAPKGWTVATPEQVWIAKDATDHSLICKVALQFHNAQAQWSVRFAKS